MKQLIRKTALSVLGSAPVYQALQRRALRDNPITILCYHTLGTDHESMDAWTVLRADDFRQHIQFLRSQYDIVSLDQALAGPGNAQRPQVVLTFDDGDIGLHTHLLPILRAETLPVTIYIATAQIEHQQPYWFDRVMNALQNPSGCQIDLRGAGLGLYTVPASTGTPKDPARWQAISDILEHLKTVSPRVRENLSADILRQVGEFTAVTTPLHPLTLDQLKELAANPNVTIGAHSHCHNLLDQIPIAEALDSISHSRQLLRDWTGQGVCHFAYPNGNHNKAVEEIVTQAGFSSATVLDNHLAPRDANLYALSRLAIGRYDQIARLKLRLVNR